MPGRLTTVVKGTFCASTDAHVNKVVGDQDKARLRAWIDALEDTGKTLKQTGIDFGVMVGGGSSEAQKQAKHFDEFFGSGIGSFFPEINDQIKVDVVRGAFIQGLRASLYERYVSPTDNQERATLKPVSVYWIAGAPAFEAYVADSVAEVHVLILTPDPTPDLVPPPLADSRDERIWLVACPGRADAIRKRASYNYSALEPMPAGIGIECQKIKSY
jgi:hypothetical protein